MEELFRAVPIITLMLNYSGNTSQATISFVVKIMTALVAAALLLFSIGKTAADEGSTAAVRPEQKTAEKKPASQPKPREATNEWDEEPLIPFDGSLLASLKFWEKKPEKENRKPQQPAGTASTKKPKNTQGTAKPPARQTSVPVPAEPAGTGLAPEPPPIPHLESNAAFGEAPLPGSTVQSDALSDIWAAQERQSANMTYESYSFDTRDWIDTFAPHLEQNPNANIIKPRIHSAVPSNKTQKTALRSLAVTPQSNPQTAGKQNEWDGHATMLVLPERPDSTGVTVTSAVSHNHLVPAAPIHATPAPPVAANKRQPIKPEINKSKIDLSPSYRRNLPYLQTCGVVVVQSNFPLTEIASILDEIDMLQCDLTRYIGVPEPQEKIELCLFKDNKSYVDFLEEYFPRAPIDRRALFVKLDKKPGTLMVQKTKDFEIDLRHEMTHAIIHASIPEVPIWLDEGLAKYFEVPAEDRLRKNPYMSQIQWNIRLGVVPSLDRLTKLETIDDMGPKEYRDSWAWTHFLIHRSPDTHRLLAAYLQFLVKWSTDKEAKKTLEAEEASAGKRIKSFFTEDLLGKESQVPSLKLYLDDLLPNQREKFKEHFSSSEKVADAK